MLHCYGKKNTLRTSYLNIIVRKAYQNYSYFCYECYCGPKEIPAGEQKPCVSWTYLIKDVEGDVTVNFICFTMLAKGIFISTLYMFTNSINAGHIVYLICTVIRLTFIQRPFNEWWSLFEIKQEDFYFGIYFDEANKHCNIWKR